MKVLLIIAYLAANLYFVLNIIENRYGKALSPKQQALGMGLTVLLITIVFLPHFWGYGTNIQSPGNFYFVLLTIIFCGLWLLLRFKPGIYVQIRRYLIWLCSFLLFALIVWPFLFGH